MTNSPGQQPRAEVSPPRESTARLHRTGYLALAASGLALSTAFAAVAHIAAPEDAPAQHRTTAQSGRSANTSGGGGPELVPGEAIPAEATVVIDGVAVTGTLPTSADSPTTVVSIGADGEPTTSVYDPPKKSGPIPNSPSPTGASNTQTDPNGGDDPPNPGSSGSQEPTGTGTTNPEESESGTSETSTESSSPSSSETTSPGGGGSPSGTSTTIGESATTSGTSTTAPSTTSRAATTSSATPAPTSVSTTTSTS